jgi:ABC-type polysaccharide/polyol phosphate transport system ATPase subunit
MLPVFVLALLAGVQQTVKAEDATVTFGSDSYTSQSGASFPVGIYLRSEEMIGDYNVEIQYDNLRLQYVEGASAVDEENGILILQGTGNSTEIKYWILFDAISGGEAQLRVLDAEIYQKDSDTEELLTVATLDSSPVIISGDDTAAVEEVAENAVTVEDTTDVGDMADGQDAAENAGIAEEAAVDAQESAQAADAGVSAETDDSTTGKKGGMSFLFNVYVFFGLTAVALIVIVEMFLWLALSFRRKKEQIRLRAQKEFLEVENFDDITELKEREVPAVIQTEEPETEGEKPVIVVDDVTMEFHLSSSNPSGLKEYLIQLLKREVTYRKLYALYHVSFNVYRGEIVGIIGTNGSGKSTLLKIISGALKPTEGQVKVNRKKIQLLTLGTGFDAELTARENVYLNGSIVGYSKEFLDSHYDEIVEFAELHDFMEEKVKNFSSGMVSRLGFAIATAGDAAEILILDEVLSVGDEFFRKKSLKRVKEMIHGGSTVLMVSHGMGTILDNCTKCVWIEKGKLKMIGEPKVVCETYRKSNEGERTK